MGRGNIVGAPLRGKRVLVVDDETAEREEMEKIREMGHRGWDDCLAG
jgi:hypothetical protein